MTLNQFLPIWELRAQENKPSTQAVNRSYLRVLVAKFGHRSLAELRPVHLQAFISRAKQTYAPRTVANMVGLFRSIWNAAEQWDYVVGKSPFRGLKIGDTSPTTTRSFTEDEVRRIIEAAPEPDATFFALAAETGLRAGELCGLQREDLQLATRGLLIRRSIWSGRVVTTKTPKGTRNLALSVSLWSRLAVLSEHSGFLFPNRRGRPWDPGSVVKCKLHPILARLGIPRAGLHAFRHYNATMMDRLRVPMKVRQERLGHSDPALTLGTYTHSASEDEQAFVRAMGGEK